MLCEAMYSSHFYCIVFIFETNFYSVVYLALHMIVVWGGYSSFLYRSVSPFNKEENHVIYLIQYIHTLKKSLVSVEKGGWYLQQHSDEM
jgi:hypothetical protein